jgi:two-component system, NtrC family, sensor kinase
MILQNRLKAKGSQPDIVLVKNYGLLPQVECYAGQLNQVFMNILSNAIDALETSWDGAIGTSPEIQIHTLVEKPQFAKGEHPWVQISIRDNGTGISPELINRLFDPFFTTKPVGKGTGLGLAISHSIVVEKHNGRINCYSEPGKGTEFLISIPIQQKGGVI